LFPAAPLKLAPFLIRSPLPFAALPSISLFPSARFTDDSEVRDQPSCNNAVTILAHAIRQDRSAPPADRPKATKESCTISVRACSGGLFGPRNTRIIRNESSAEAGSEITSSDTIFFFIYTHYLL